MISPLTINLLNVSRYVWFVVWPTLPIMLTEWDPFDGLNMGAYWLICLPLYPVVANLLYAIHKTCIEFHEEGEGK